MIKILGVHDMNFETRDGDLIDGVKIFWTEEPSQGQLENGMIGLICDRQFLNRDTYNRILSLCKLDTLLNFQGNFIYNKKGKIEGVIK